MQPNRGRRALGRCARGLALLLGLLGLTSSGVRPASAQVSPLPNGGFETGDLTGWRTFCTDAAAGGCDQWSIAVGPEFARSGGFGVRLFNAHVGWYGHAELRSSGYFEDASTTYTFPLKLVAGADRYYSGVSIRVQDDTGRAVVYVGNTLGMAHPNYPVAGLFRMVPGQWAEYTFDILGDFMRLWGVPPTRRRYVVIDAYQDDAPVEVYADDVLVPRAQQSSVGVASLTLSRAQIRGSELVQGDVTLNAPAPPGGAVVTLVSHLQAAPAPASLFIPAGATRGMFTIQAAAAPVTRTAWITATYGNGAASAELTVAPAAVTSLSVPQTRVTGGEVSLATVQFAAPSTYWGGPVSLFSSDPAVAMVPPGVSVIPGTSEATFRVATTAVTVPTAVYLTAISPLGVAVARIAVVPPSTPQPVLGGVTAAVFTTPEGRQVSATVTLTGPAPPGGASVTLTSPQGILVLPASATVPAGQTAATLTLTAQPVLSPTTITLSAHYAGQTRSVQVTVAPPSIAAISVEPEAVLGGESTVATVTLTAPAAAGMVVPLANSATAAASIPARVVVPAGATSVSFPVITRPVTAYTVATLTADYNERYQSVWLRIHPTSTLEWTTTDLQVLGGRSTTGIVTLVGPLPVAPFNVTLRSDNPAVATLPSQVTFPPGQRAMKVPVLTQPVAVSTTVGVYAEWTTDLRRGIGYGVTVLPPELASLELGAAAITGGASTTGTLTLTGPAPAGGTVVTLTGSDDALVAVPASVRIPAGATSARFPIVTRPVSAPGVITFAATLDLQTRYSALLLNGTALSTLTLAPSQVTGGASLEGTLTLTNPAPSGGAVIALSSDNPAVATVPAGVTVPAGATEARFLITTHSIAAATPVVLTAAYSGNSQTASVIVLPATLTALTLDAATVAGGESVRLTLTLSGPAPPGGAVIALSSDNPALAALPATVTVPAGTATLTLPVAVSPVPSLTRLQISASFGGVTRSATLAVATVTLAWLRLGQSRVLGGTEVVGALMLSEPAPAGGVAVALFSDRSDVANPPQRVRVEEGTLLAFFAVKTTAVTSETRVLLTASVGGVRQEVVIVMLPAGGL